MPGTEKQGTAETGNDAPSKYIIPCFAASPSATSPKRYARRQGEDRPVRDSREFVSQEVV